MKQHVSSIRTDRLLERFLRYVCIGSAANPNSTDYPSSQGQVELGKILLHELQAMGVEDCEQDSHGLVWATIPASVSSGSSTLPTILFNAHLDTSPEAPGDNVVPQVIEQYAGGDIALPKNGGKIEVDSSPELDGLVGHCLVTTDGSTLLGGDDKAGVAAIMELAHHLIENPHLPHGPVRILFTCDEEIGRGAKYMDLEKAAAVAGYTLDGSGHGEVENENFSADHLHIVATGHNIHPAIAKGKMHNALRGLSALIAALPLDRLSPESTEGRAGFIHPYEVTAGVGKAEAKLLLRDFATENLDALAECVTLASKEAQKSVPGVEYKIQRERQYRNMADSLKNAPSVVALALKAHELLGFQPRTGSIRGGTDGAMFSEMGLPTPNLSVGQHNIHSVLEFVSVTEMTLAVEHAIKLLELWQDTARS